MKKNDVVEGQHYVRASSKEYLRWGSTSRVVVVENEVYAQRARFALTQDFLRQDPKYAEAHLAASLCEAYPNDCTPNEKRIANLQLEDIANGARERWLAEDPMRHFVKSASRWSGYGDPGVLCRRVDDSGEVIDGQYLKDRNEKWEEDNHLRSIVHRDGLFPVPRRELRSTWRDYVADKKAQEEATARARKAQEEATRERLQDREALIQTLVALGYKDVGTGVEGPAGYISIPSYAKTVELRFSQLNQLLAPGQEG